MSTRPLAKTSGKLRADWSVSLYDLLGRKTGDLTVHAGDKIRHYQAFSPTFYSDGRGRFSGSVLLSGRKEWMIVYGHEAPSF